MDKFTTLTAIAAPLPLINVDTDMIIPKLFLRTIKRTGLGVNLFNDMRYNEDGTEISDFVLNRAPYREAGILVAGANFGCGSSREHAPWALLDFGIKCVIAPSFADIFYNNCFKNGILPLILDEKRHSALMEWLKSNEGAQITVDLDKQTLHWDNIEAAFEIDPFRKHCLLNGLDDIGLTLEKERAISAYEARNKEERPWLWQDKKSG